MAFVDEQLQILATLHLLAYLGRRSGLVLFAVEPVVEGDYGQAEVEWVLAVGAAMVSSPVVRAAPGSDPGYGLYPQRDELLRSKGCADCVTDQPVKIDITAQADLQAQIDSIAELLSKGPVPDGGLSWDADTRTVLVRAMTLADRMCWESLERGDVGAFSRRAMLVAQLHGFGVCADLLGGRTTTTT